MERTKTSIDIVLLLLISGLIFFWNLGTGSLSSWDEGLYAQVSREIMKSGNWIDLTYGGEHWVDKPPLYMWVTVIFYQLFGVNEFSARLFSCLCGIGTVIVTYLLGKKLYSRNAGLAAALILASTYQFIWASKVGMLDATLTFFISLSLFFFILGLERKAFLFFSMLAFTCAFLTKGAGALIAPIIMGLYLIFSRQLKIIKEPAFLWGIIVSLIILIYWHALAISHYGSEFIRKYFIRHLLTRTTQAMEGHTGTFFTYFNVLTNKGRPWGVFAFICLFIAAWRIFFRKEIQHLLPVIWFAFILLAFSLVKTKLHWYAVPIYPACAMLVGWGLSKVFRRFTVVAALILAVSGVLYLSGAKKVFDLDFSPETKEMIIFAKNTIPNGKPLYLWGIGDPGMRFYSYDIGRNVPDLELGQVLKEKDNYILFEVQNRASLAKAKLLILKESNNFVIAKTN